VFDDDDDASSFRPGGTLLGSYEMRRCVGTMQDEEQGMRLVPWSGKQSLDDADFFPTASPLSSNDEIFR
jgi:hypothetical protein